MAKLEVLPDLTIQYIFERVTQEEIMEFYTGIPVNRHTLSGNSFTSPMRTDKNPTCNYYYHTDKKGITRLKLKDWNGSFDGDVFDVAAWATKINTKTSQGFKLLQHAIAKDFKIHKYKDDSSERTKLETFINTYIEQQDIKVFKVVPRAWNGFDKKYWYDTFGVPSVLLKEAKVIPVQEFYIEDNNGYMKKVYSYYSKDPAYAYYGGKVNGITIWKIYFPSRNRTQKKFFVNYNFIQGKHLFQPAKVGIITKSYKDVLVFKLFGIEAIGIPSETYVMTKDEVFDIKSKCDIVLTNFDYDRAGILLANRYKREHGIQPLMFTRGRYNQPDFGVKDFSEFREAFGFERTLQLVLSLYDKYQEDLEFISRYNYESLKWIVQCL